MKLIDMHKLFQESVAKTVNFNVGYYEVSQQAKIWLVVPNYLKAMLLIISILMVEQ